MQNVALKLGRGANIYAQDFILIKERTCMTVPHLYNMYFIGQIILKYLYPNPNLS